jgi:phosphoglucosamine mutase
MPITPEFVLRLGYAAGKVLASDRSVLPLGQHPGVLIGKDTRLSGYMLESALIAGFTASGVNVKLVGPMPTPAVAHLTRAFRLQAGVVISASHNPFEDNGIKFFSGAGQKLPDATELAIEACLEEPMHTVSPREFGRAKRLDDAAARYIEFCKSAFPFERHLRGLRLVIDCANGATYHVAPHVFHELGAEVITIGNTPDGYNINLECGATHPQTLSAAVRQHRADFGIALDGDGDRLMMADADGRVFDGDQLVYAIARHRVQTGYMKGGVVGTQMSNLGFERAIHNLGLSFVRAKVGDRHVLEELQTRQWQLGGETSGHILCLDKHTTGDGIISALQVLLALRDNDQGLAEYTSALVRFPQVMINVPTRQRIDLKSADSVRAIEAAAVKDMGAGGRIVLRASGTEPLIRVMVESESGEQAHKWAQALADAVRTSAA